MLLGCPFTHPAVVHSHTLKLICFDDDLTTFFYYLSSTYLTPVCQSKEV